LFFSEIYSYPPSHNLEISLLTLPSYDKVHGIIPQKET
jgi:hypothetical protein